MLITTENYISSFPIGGPLISALIWLFQSVLAVFILYNVKFKKMEITPRQGIEPWSPA